MEKLEKLLQSGKWEAANTETHIIIRDKFRHINNESYSKLISLYKEGFRNFPCEDIIALDNLWEKYSKKNIKKRFGISVQKDIYKRVGGRLDGEDQGYYEKEITDVWKDFSSKVGWNWNSLDNRTISFDNLEAAPDGYLPYWNEEMITTSGFIGLFCCMENCKPSDLQG